MNNQQRMFVEKISKASSRFQEAKVSLKLYEDEIRNSLVTPESSLLFESMKLQKMAEVKAAEYELLSMKNALRYNTILCFKIHEEVDVMLKAETIGKHYEHEAIDARRKELVEEACQRYKINEKIESILKEYNLV